MNRTESACYLLLASAFVLTGILIVQLGHRITPEAKAEMAIKSGGVSMMTATTRQGEESLFLIEDTSERLLVYTADPSRKRLELQAVLDLSNAFRTRVESSRGDADNRPGVSPR